MVRLTDEQKAMLETLDKKPDNEIDLSDIPEITDWSGFKTGLFYRPKWKDFSLRLDKIVQYRLESGLPDGQSLDEAVNRALGAQMYRIRFPVRVQKAEKTIRLVRESPDEIQNLTERQKQEIETLYAMPVEKVASSLVAVKSLVVVKRGIEEQRHTGTMDVCLKLDENIIDWFEDRLEAGQTRDEVLNKALIDHIHWVSSPCGMQQEEEPAGKAGDSA